jgi:succinyl-CoA synthetase alpha subunit
MGRKLREAAPYLINQGTPNMKLNEHQSKRLLREVGVETPEGLLLSPANFQDARPSWPLPWYLKAQVLAGGRGKAGGIRRIDHAEDLAPAARELFEVEIKGAAPPLLRLEPGVRAAREYYLSFAISRSRTGVVLTAGRQGGVEIESLDPENLLVQKLSMSQGLAGYQSRAAFFHLGADKEHWPEFQRLLEALYKAVVDYGLLLAEINPVALTPDGRWVALDGKIEIDDNHLSQHSELERFYQPEHASGEENIARESGLSFHSLQGWVGLMVNGAGLAMATMDVLNRSGLNAANFMDLGGAADFDRMQTALKLLFRDSSVQAVFINIFGGVLSCSKVAQALSLALDGQAPQKPLVVRLSGNQAEEGRAILDEMNAPGVFVTSEMNEALAVLRTLGPAGEPVRPEDIPAEEVALDEKPAWSIRTLRDRPAPPMPGGNCGVLVQGVTGRTAQLHTRLMLDYGTRIVAGVTPFKGGREVHGVPVYDSVRQAVAEHEIGASIIFVPAPFAPDAILEAAQAGIAWVVCITDGLSQHDMLFVKEQLEFTDTWLVGPNNPGLIRPGETKIGIMPGEVFTPGPVAVVSRSGTLTYEVAARLSAAGIGQSLCVGIGGDPFIGAGFTDVFSLLAEDDKTEAVVVLGEIGGQAEEELARYVAETGLEKPVVGFIAGQTAPPGKRLGHAGAILESEGGTRDKLAAMLAAGFILCPDLTEVAGTVRAALDRKG